MQSLADRLLDIELPVTTLARQVFHALMQQTIAREEGEFLVVIGDPGSGKSHLRRQLFRDAEKLCCTPDRPLGCIELVLEAAPTLLALTRQIARAYNNPATMHKILDKSKNDVSFEVLGDIKRQGTSVIFIDEGHNMTFKSRPAGSSEADDPMAMWLKNLTYLGVSVVFFALPEFDATTKRVREISNRLYRDTPIVLRGLTGQTKADVDAALRFLDDLQNAHQVVAVPRFSEEGVAMPLIRATGGNLRRIARIVQSAIDQSRYRGSPQVELTDFASAARLAGMEWR